MSNPRRRDAPGISRRLYFLYRFQAKYALAFILLNNAIAVIIAFASFKVFDQLGGEAFEKNLKWLAIGVVGLAISSLGIFYLLVALASQRVAAPLSAMTRALTQLAAGEKPKTEWHSRTDELWEIFATLESAIEAFQVRRSQEISAFQKAIQTLSTLHGSPKIQELQTELETLLQAQRQGMHELESPLSGPGAGTDLVVHGPLN